jgi:hypothetical protein
MTMADHQGVLLRLHHLVVQPVRQTFHIWSIGHRGGSRRRTPFVLPLRRQLRRGGVSGAAGAQSRSEPEAADTATPGAGRRVYITFRDTTKGSDARLNSVAHESNVRSPQLPPGTARIEFMRAQVDPARMLHQREHVPGQQVWHRQLAPAIAHARLFRRAECHPLMILVRLERDRQVNRRSGIARARWRVMRSARVASRATAGACGLCGRIRRSCGTCVQCIDNSSS